MVQRANGTAPNRGALHHQQLAAVTVHRMPVRVVLAPVIMVRRQPADAATARPAVAHAAEVPAATAIETKAPAQAHGAVARPAIKMVPLGEPIASVPTMPPRSNSLCSNLLCSDECGRVGQTRPPRDTSEIQRRVSIV